MKRYRKDILRYSFLVSALLSIVSCVDKDIEIDERPIRLSAGTAFNPTRAAIGVQGAAFDAGETVNVFIQGSTNNGSTWTNLTDDFYSTDLTQWRTSSPKGITNQYNDLMPIGHQPHYPLGSNSDVKIRLHASYPPSVGTTNTTGLFTVESDQTNNTEYKNSDLMFVPPFEHQKDKSVISLPFQHKMAKLIVTAVADDSVSVDNYIVVGGIKRTVGIDVENGDFTTDPNTGASPILSDETDGTGFPTIKVNNGGALLFPPQLVTTPKFVMVTGRRLTKEGVWVDASAQFDIIHKNFKEAQVYKLTLHIGTDDFMPLEDGSAHISTITGWSDDYAELTVTPSGGYKGVQIEDINGNLTLIGEEPSEDGCYVYTGIPRCPKPKVTYGTTSPVTLEEGEDKDFVYTWVDNTNAGTTAQVLVMGRGNYTGLAALKAFTIKKAKAKITFPDEIDDRDDYTGKTMTLDFNPDENIDAVVVNNTGDGDVHYEIVATETNESTDCASINPIDANLTIQNVGKATVRAIAVDGRNYRYESADATDTYKLVITPKVITETNLQVDYQPKSFIYDGKEKKLSQLVVSDGEHTLASGVDYTYEFTDSLRSGDAPKHAGSALLTITGKGNYDKNTKIEIKIPIRQNKPQINIAKKTTLWMGKHSDLAPVNRRKTRVATTDDWAAHNLKYESLNTNIATVNSKTGLITGISKGQTFIVVSVPKDETEHKDFLAADTVMFPVNVVEADFTYTLQRENKAGFVEPQLKRDANGVPIGAHNEWTCPATGTWQIDCYGAQGSSTPKYYHADGTGGTLAVRGKGGRGAHIGGRIDLYEGMTLHVVLGEQGITNYRHETRNKLYIPEGKVELTKMAWNGGGGLNWGGRCNIYPRYYNTTPIIWYGDINPETGARGWPENVVFHPISGGGGATDVSLAWGQYLDKYDNIVNTNLRTLDWKSTEHLYSRIIVAAGGGGAINYGSTSGFGDGGDGGAWAGQHGQFNDYGEGGEVNRGGWGGNRHNWVLNPSAKDTGSALSGTSAHSETYTITKDGQSQTVTVTYQTEPNGGQMKHDFTVYKDGPYAGGYSCTDGMFGEGGYFTQPEQGAGCGGGGWYGGGAGGEVGSNGSGGGGSSFIWTDKVTVKKALRKARPAAGADGASVTMASLYDTIDEDYQAHNGVAPSITKTNYKNYRPTTDKNGTGIYCPYFTSVTSHDSGANGGDGWAKITLIEIPGD